MKNEGRISSFFVQKSQREFFQKIGSIREDLKELKSSGSDSIQNMSNYQNQNQFALIEEIKEEDHLQRDSQDQQIQDENQFKLQRDSSINRIEQLNIEQDGDQQDNQIVQNYYQQNNQIIQNNIQQNEQINNQIVQDNMQIIQNDIQIMNQIEIECDLKSDDCDEFIQGQDNIQQNQVNRDYQIVFQNQQINQMVQQLGQEQRNQNINLLYPMNKINKNILGQKNNDQLINQINNKLSKSFIQLNQILGIANNFNQQILLNNPLVNNNKSFESKIFIKKSIQSYQQIQLHVLPQIQDSLRQLQEVQEKQKILEELEIQKIFQNQQLRNVKIDAFCQYDIQDQDNQQIINDLNDQQYQVNNLEALQNNQNLVIVENNEQIQQPENELMQQNEQNYQIDQNNLQIVEQQQIFKDQIEVQIIDAVLSQKEQNNGQEAVNQSIFQNQSEQNSILNQKQEVIISQLQKIKDLQLIINNLQNDLQQQQIEKQSHKYQIVQIQKILLLISDIEQDIQANENREFFDRSFVQQVIQFLNQSVYSSTLVNNLINDLLDMAKFESGTFQFYEEYFDLLDVINSSFSIIEHQTQKKQINISLQLHHISQLDFEKLETIQSESDFQNDKTVLKALSLKNESQNQQPIEQLKKVQPFSQKNLNFIDFISKQNLSQQSNSLLIESEISPQQYQRSQRSIFDSNQCEIDKQDSFEKKMQSLFINEFNEIKIKKLLSNIYGDRNRYQQILINFLSNAVKFSNKGGNITVRLIVLDQQRFADKRYAKSYYQKSKRKNNLQDSKEKNIHQLNDGILIDQQIIQIPKIQSNYSIQSLYSQKSEQFKNSKEHLLSESLPRIQTFQDINSLENLKKQKFENITDFNRSKEEFKFHTQKGSKSTFDEGFISFLIQVIDNGVGIKEENIGKLFLDFSKLNEHASINRGGTGLGLSICKKIIEKMGGQVSVQSQINKGTQFTVKLRTKFKEIDKEINKSETKSLDDIRSEIGNQSSQSKENQLSNSQNQSCQIIISDQPLQSSKDQRINIINNSNTKQRKMSHQPYYKKFGVNLSSSQEYVLSSKDNGIQSNINSGQSNISLMKSQIESLQQSSASNSQSLISVINIIQQKNSNQKPNENSNEDFKYNQKSNSNVNWCSENFINRGQVKQQYLQNPESLISDQIQEQKQKGINNISNQIQAEKFFSIRKESSGYHKISAEWGGINNKSSLDNIFQKIDSQENLLIKLSELKKSSSSNSNKQNQIFQNRSKNSSQILQSLQEEEKKQSINKYDNYQIYSDELGQSQFLNNKLNKKNEKNRMSLIENYEQNNQIIKKNKSKLEKKQKEHEEIRCLVANDNTFQMMVIQCILNKQNNFKVSEAVNGWDALQQVQKSKIPFDFIILDLDMPIMDGYEAAEKIIQHHQKSENVLAPQMKQQKRIKKDKNQLDNLLNNKNLQEKNKNQLQQQLLNLMDEDIPILIALSALVDDQVRKRCEKFGFDLVLEAPLTQEHIEQDIIPMVIRNRNLYNLLQQIQQE